MLNQDVRDRKRPWLFFPTKSTAPKSDSAPIQSDAKSFPRDMQCCLNPTI